MRKLLAISPAFRMALVAVAGAAIFAIWSVSEATRVDGVDSLGDGQTITVVGDIDPVRLRSARISDAVDRDPLSPTRTRPSRRYRLPGEVEEETATARPQRLQWSMLWYNVDVPAESKFYGQLGNLPPVGAKVGGKIGTYTLLAVWPDSVLLASANGDSLTLNKPRRR